MAAKSGIITWPPESLVVVNIKGSQTDIKPANPPQNPAHAGVRKKDDSFTSKSAGRNNNNHVAKMTRAEQIEQ